MLRAGPLVSLFLLRQRGRADELPPARPPHLCDRLWRFACPCGHTPYTARADIAVRDYVLTPPRRLCPACRQPVDGVPVSDVGADTHT